MKKMLRYANCLLTIILTAATFTACSDDDEKNLLGDGSHDPELAQTWVNGTGEPDTWLATFTFKSNGTYRFEEKYICEDGEYCWDEGEWRTEDDGYLILTPKKAHCSDCMSDRKDWFSTEYSYQISNDGKTLTFSGGRASSHGGRVFTLEE